MTTKHKPATALPWEADERAYIENVADDYRVCETLRLESEHRHQDAAFIAHAANAYPKLIEALCWYSQGVEQDDDGACARALLRELGEES